MRSKLTTVCVTVAAFAAFAALPAVASASPQLTYPTGTRLATGSKFRGHNLELAILTFSQGTLDCSKATITGTLTKNNGTKIEGNIESATFTGTEPEERCSGPTGSLKYTFPSVPWCIQSTAVSDGFSIRGGNCTEEARALTFIQDSSLAGECKYEKASLSGTFTTHPEDAEMSISEQEFVKEAGGILCPASFKLDLTLTLERDIEGTQPLYVS